MQKKKKKKKKDCRRFWKKTRGTIRKNGMLIDLVCFVYGAFESAKNHVQKIIDQTITESLESLTFIINASVK